GRLAGGAHDRLANLLAVFVSDRLKLARLVWHLQPTETILLGHVIVRPGGNCDFAQGGANIFSEVSERDAKGARVGTYSMNPLTPPTFLPSIDAAHFPPVFAVV